MGRFPCYVFMTRSLVCPTPAKPPMQRGCTTGDCSAWHWYSLVVWAIWGSVLIAMSVLALRLRHSFSHQPGDLLEGALNRMLDIATCVRNRCRLPSSRPAPPSTCGEN